MSQMTCFVIMPFGQKDDSTGETVDFDDIYEGLIRETVESRGFRCVRCDDLVTPGMVHRDMIEHIRRDEIAIVDITSLNANVFYELGVRHALKERVTVLIRRAGTKLPFNIQGMRVIEYETSKLSLVVKAKRLISEAINEGLSQLRTDSLVFEILGSATQQATSVDVPIAETHDYGWKLAGGTSEIRLITGDIKNVKGIDAWVNSENTNMQMARFYDRSVSGLIRYLGAKKENGVVVEDTIADALAKNVGFNLGVPPATVIHTTAGELEQTHGVKAIFHVASVVGSVGQGYTPIPNVEDCVTAVLSKADSAQARTLAVESVVFPLIGTGTARANSQNTVRLLIDKAATYLRNNPDSAIKRVYFICRTQSDLSLCQSAIKTIPGLSSV